MGKVIVVTSGKGGVGKTTSTAALGAALSPLRRRMIEDMTVRKFTPTQGDYIRVVKNFTISVSEEKHAKKRYAQPVSSPP
jgi:septum site-determining protein MinD